MKAVVFQRHGGVEVLEHRSDVPVPEVGPGEALLRVRATAMNHNDIWARTGLPGMDFMLPHISGSDAAGVVEAVGDEVIGVRPGDEVIVHGFYACGKCPDCLDGVPFACSANPDANETLTNFKVWGFHTGPLQGGQAEYAVLPARCLLPKPANLSFEEAASLGLVLGTVWRMLVVRARIKPGDFVLIWGAAGGLGSMAIQVCTLFRAHPIAVVSSDEKGRFCRQLGAEHVINRRSQRVLREVGKITGRRGVDVVFEHTGAETWETSCHALKWAGTIVTCGATSGFRANLDIRYLWNKQQNYLGSHCCTRGELAEALKFVENGLIRPAVGKILPLSEIAKAHEMFERREVMGKIVLVP